MVLLIDGSSLLSTSFYGNVPREYLKCKTEEEYNVVLPKLLQTTDGIYTNGIYGFCKTLKKIETKYHPEYLAVAWDLNRNTFRRKMYPDYKAQRKPTRQELSSQFEYTQKLLDYIGIYSFGIDGLEADDLVGSMAKKYADQDVVILTKDHDQLQLIDSHTTVWLNAKVDDIIVELGIKQSDVPTHPEGYFPFDEKTFESYYGFKPIQIIDYKALAGDSSDNIPGIKGVGEKSATELIKEFGSVESIVDFITTADKKTLDAKKEEFKARGATRIPLKALSEDMVGGPNMGLLCKKLATIKTDVENIPNLEDIRYAPNDEKRTKIYNRLQFKSLL